MMLLLLSPVAQAQSPLTVEVDRTRLSSDELLLLRVEVNSTSTNSPPPTLPTFDSFAVVGQSTSSQVSVVNGVVSAKVIYQYRLQPTQVGSLTIPPVTINLDGQSYSSDPITVEVTAGTTPTPPPAPGDNSALTGDQDFVVQATVDNPQPYVGQQINHVFRFYQGVEVYGNIQYNAPPFTGFWNEQEAEQTQSMTEAAGRPYRLTQLNTILFPTVAGETVIQPARLMLPDRQLNTDPITVTVQPLPPDEPADFSGAVGQFSLTATLPMTQSKVNEPLTLLVTLQGQGNINNLPDPTWPSLSNWRLFESKATINTEVQNGILGGSRVYELLLVPGQAGEFTLPAVSYTYFDPLVKAYQTTSSQPIALAIAPGEEEPAIPVVVGGDKEEILRLGSDIRHIKTLPDQLTSARPPLTDRASYWMAWLVPVLFLALHWGWQRRQDYLSQNLDVVRRSQARRKAKQALEAARQQSPRQQFEAAEEILTIYLSDKLNRPVGGLTQKALAELLREQQLATDLIEQVQRCLNDSHIGQFALSSPDAAQATQLLARVETLIDHLEKAFNNVGKRVNSSED